MKTWIQTPKNDGTSEQWYADDTNAYNWTTIDAHRNTLRQTTGYDVAFDDGSKETVVLDYNNSQDWSWLDVHFNNAGQRTYSKIMYDDGSSEMSFHDPNNQNTWDYQKQHFNAAGGLDDLFTINDDDSIDHTEYNLSNPAADWTSKLTRQNADHQTTDDWMTLRDGSQIHTRYDYNDKHTWQTQEATYDSNGNLEHWTNIYEDGHQVYHHV